MNNPDERVTQIFAFFGRRYPGRALGVVSLLLLAGLSEGISISALFPFLEGVSRGTASVSGGFGELVTGMLDAAGLEPTIGILILIIGFGMVMKGILQWLAMQQVGFLAARSVTDLRLDLLEGLFGARWSFFSHHKTGELSNSLSGECGAAGQAFQKAARMMALSVEVAIYLIIVLFVSWETAAFALGSGAFAFFIVRSFIRRSRAAASAEAVDARDFVGRIVSVVHAVRPVRSMAREESYHRRLRDQAERVNRHVRGRVRWTTATAALQEPLMVVGLLVAFGVVNAAFDLDFAELLVLGFLFWRSARALNRVQITYQELANLTRYFGLVTELIDELSSEREREDGEDVRIEGPIALRLRQVTFAYEESRPVLRSLDLDAKAQEVTVLIGESGAGKSTLLDIVLGFREPDSGTVEIVAANGTFTLSKLRLRSWRRSIGYVPQDAAILNDSLRQNVLMGAEDLDDDDVWRALRIAQLDQVVEDMPEGLATMVGEHGARLSGGQRRRLALARAIVHRPALLILDEVTAGLDPDTENALLDAMLSVGGDTTVLSVTHQRGLVDRADALYSIRGGVAHSCEATAL